MKQTEVSFQAGREVLIVGGLLSLQYLAWDSHSFTRFNGLATPLFLCLAGYLVFLAPQYRLNVTFRSLFLYLLYAAWALFADMQSGQFLPAAAKNTHWLVLPIACLLIADVLRNFDGARRLLRVGASLCIVNFVLTAYVNADFYDSWIRVPVFGSPRHLGLTMGAVSLFLFGNQEPNRPLSIVFRICRILGLAVMFWTGTRAAILAWVICLGLILYCNPRQIREVLVDNCIAIGLSFAQPPPYHSGDGALPQFLGGTPIRPLREITLESLSSGRISIWWSTILSMHEQGRLWIGVGGNGFARLQTLYAANISYRGHVQAHNALVQGICDAGIVGAAALLVFAISSLGHPIAAGLRRKDALPLAGIGYLMITGMLDATLYHLEHLLYLTLFIGLLYAGQTVRDQNTEGRLSIPWPITVFALALFGVIHLLTLDYHIGLYWYFPT